MSRARRAVRQTLTIARRDFTATVFTPVFLLFLFAPVIMGSFGAIAGAGTASVAAGERTRIAAILPAQAAAALIAADRRLRSLYRDKGDAPPPLDTVAPTADPATQARAVFARTDVDAPAVLYGPLDRPTILAGPSSDRAVRYLVALAQDALAAQRLGGALPRVEPRRMVVRREAPTRRGGNQSAFFAVFGVFFLTLFLAGQVVGTMAEERNNKVIEVLAAAVPLECVFLGKLVGMFGSAVVFVLFWATLLSQIGPLMPAGLRAGLTDLAPATGALFPVLFACYFTMAYMLLGSVFLGIGAQATTPRELQMLALPITVTQVAMFAFASAVSTRPGSGIALVAELFPLSSPYAMVAHAANRPELWPHAAALAWQLLWVALFITIGARLFRRGVLQSGGARRSAAPAKAIDIAVS